MKVYHYARNITVDALFFRTQGNNLR